MNSEHSRGEPQVESDGSSTVTPESSQMSQVFAKQTVNYLGKCNVAMC